MSDEPLDLSRMNLATRALIIAVVAAFAFALWALHSPVFAMSRAG